MFSTNGRKVLSAVSPGSLLALASLRAQEASPSPAPSGSVLNRVVVTGANIPIDESIIPTTQPSGVVFGLDINVKDVPRNVTIISRAQTTMAGSFFDKLQGSASATIGTCDQYRTSIWAARLSRTNLPFGLVTLAKNLEAITRGG